jgi:hypothetical protein
VHICARGEIEESFGSEDRKAKAPKRPRASMSNADIGNFRVGLSRGFSNNPGSRKQEATVIELHRSWLTNRHRCHT